MKKLRKTNGITLIALIITILVLLIIAGVVIGTINGGIFGNANKSAEKYNNEVRKEDELLGALENKLKDYTGENPSTPDQPTKEPTNVEYFSWTTTETEATITGFSDAGKEKYNAGEITELVIPGEYNGLKVTTINGGAFKGCTGIKELYIYKELQSVKIAQNGLNYYGAFNGCTNIEKVEFEEGITKIPDNMLYKAGLKENVNIIIPSSVTEIGESAFYNCTGIKNIDTLFKSVTKIGNSAFSGCTGITNINIGEKVKEIGEWAFASCTRASNVKIPRSVTIINGATFYNCTGIKELYIYKELQNVKIAQNGLNYCGAFNGCTNIEKVEFEEGITKIPDNMLYKAGLKENVNIIIPSSVTEIGKSAFYNCTTLSEITIPKSIIKIVDYAFYQCSSLKKINYTGNEQNWRSVQIGNNNAPLTSATINYNQ